jgi:hypothetical protein
MIQGYSAAAPVVPRSPPSSTKLATIVKLGGRRERKYIPQMRLLPLLGWSVTGTAIIIITTMDILEQPLVVCFFLDYKRLLGLAIGKVTIIVSKGTWWFLTTMFGTIMLTQACLLSVQLIVMVTIRCWWSFDGPSSTSSFCAGLGKVGHNDRQAQWTSCCDMLNLQADPLRRKPCA